MIYFDISQYKRDSPVPNLGYTQGGETTESLK